MENYSMRAVFFGVSIFVTMLTLSLIMTYYNTSKTAADAVNDRIDIAETFDMIVNDSETYIQKLSGVEVRSLIRKYAGDSNVEINIVSIKSIPAYTYNNINNTWLETDTGIIKETLLSIINPAWQNRVHKTVEGEKIILDIHLDIVIDLV